jgi:SAM-dependent methyltransferase
MSIEPHSTLPNSRSGTAGVAQVETRLRCGVCGSSEGTLLAAREMMFGFRHEFEYFECAACGCLQIKDIPENLGFYYPPEYFPKPESPQRDADLPPFFRRQRTDHLLGKRTLFGRRVVRKYGRPTVPIFGQPDYYAWLKQCGVTRSSRLLDVGCGLGILLSRLQQDGFKDLTGVDPYLDRSILRNGLRLLKQEIYDLNEQFDLIMLHHTFEHMPEPKRVFAALERLLRPGRYALIRIPVAGCYAHRKYGANWAQLDAPRHLFLHTPRSIENLAAGAGLELRHTSFDSDGFQFWASEQYVKDIPLRDPRSLNMNPAHRPFSPEELAAFNAHAAQLNAAGDGDSACFYLFKPTAPPIRTSLPPGGGQGKAEDSRP